MTRKYGRRAVTLRRAAAALSATAVVAGIGLGNIAGASAATAPPGGTGAQASHASKAPVGSAIGTPRGIFYRSDVVKAKAKAAAARRPLTQAPPPNNPACADCSPPLNFTPDDAVMGGTTPGGTPGHVTITPVY